MEKCQSVFLTTYFKVVLTKSYTSLESTLPKSISDKTASKKRWSFSKIVFWTWKQPFAIHFFQESNNVCPVAIPEIFAQTQRSDYWQSIHNYTSYNLSVFRFRFATVDDRRQEPLFFTLVIVLQLRCTSPEYFDTVSTTNIIDSRYFTELTLISLLFYLQNMTLSTSLILVVCRTRVIWAL